MSLNYKFAGNIALGLGMTGLLGGIYGYHQGRKNIPLNQSTGNTSTSDGFEVNRLAAELQAMNPSMTINQAYWEADRIYASMKEEIFNPEIAYDRGMDQSDSWQQLVIDEDEPYGVRQVPKQIDRPKNAYYYNDEIRGLEPGPWDQWEYLEQRRNA